MRLSWKTAIVIFVAIAGLIIGLVSIPDTMRFTSFIILLLIVIVLIVWVSVPIILQKRRDSLPDITKELRYSINPAINEDIDWIATLEAKVYSSHDAIPKHILKEWYDTNPSGFFIIKIRGGRRIGHIDILPIRPKTLSLFIEGGIEERDIRGDSLYSPQEKSLIKNLYIESVAISHPEGQSQASAVIYLLSNFTQIARNIGELDNIDMVYAIAASKAGVSLMKRLGFNLVKSSKDRKNGHDLFAIRFMNLAQNISEICDDRLMERPLIDKLLKHDINQGL